MAVTEQKLAGARSICLDAYGTDSAGKRYDIEISFEDGEHILYVNGEYRGESNLGKLMHDFNCTQASDMNFKLMADRKRYLKENPKGVSEMCRIMEDMRNESLQEGRREGRKEGIKEGMKEAALRMLAAGIYAIEEIANISGLSLEEVNKLKVI